MARPRQKKTIETVFGTWLKKRREAWGWTEEKVAEQSRLSRSAINAYSNGDRGPSRDAAIKIGTALRDVEGALEAAGFAVERDLDARAVQIASRLKHLAPEQLAALEAIIRSWPDDQAPTGTQAPTANQSLSTSYPQTAEQVQSPNLLHSEEPHELLA